jgi:hypothetical protein
MLFGHAGVGMPELPGNHRHGNRLHGDDRGMGVAQQTGEAIQIKASKKVAFRASKNLKEAI